MEKDTRSSLEKFGSWLKDQDLGRKFFQAWETVGADAYYRVILESAYGRHGNGERYFGNRKDDDASQFYDASDIEAAQEPQNPEVEEVAPTQEPEEDEGMEM